MMDADDHGPSRTAGASNNRMGLLQTPLPALHDTEGERVPPSLPPVIDAHVHIFPAGLYAAIWRWFEAYGWPIRYKLTAAEVIDFLLSRGVRHLVALHYAHKPGVSASLNGHMADLCRRRPQMTGMATVFPGEDDAAGVLERAFADGLRGVKLHCHVQCFDILGRDMHHIYEVCAGNDQPLVMHVGREPKSPAYKCDPYALCDAERVEQVLRTHKTLKICVPHLGADEFSAYRRLLEIYDNLWLDTTMALADYLPFDEVPDLNDFRADRVMYGTDFPHIPYSWDREIRRLSRMGLDDGRLDRILGRNAMDFFSISPPD